MSHTPYNSVVVMDKRKQIINLMILWGIVIISFGVFLFAHTSIMEHKLFIAPENYLVRAKHYYQQGNTNKALAELTYGIEHFKPVASEAYAMLLKVAETTNGKIPQKNWKAYRDVTYLLEQCCVQQSFVVDKSALTIPNIVYSTLTSQQRQLVRSIWNQLIRNPWTCLRGIIEDESHMITFLHYSGAELSFGPSFPGMTIPLNEDIIALSEGSEAGAGAQIWFQGKNYGGIRRGFYVLILTPPPCRVHRSARFDVWESISEAKAMETFLQEVPEQYIGVFAVADEASENMTDELESKLVEFGFEKKVPIFGEQRLFGYGYAFSGIGIKGAPTGSAIQNWAKYDPETKCIPVAISGVLNIEVKL